MIGSTGSPQGTQHGALMSSQTLVAQAPNGAGSESIYSAGNFGEARVAKETRALNASLCPRVYR